MVQLLERVECGLKSFAVPICDVRIRFFFFLHWLEFDNSLGSDVVVVYEVFHIKTLLTDVYIRVSRRVFILQNWGVNATPYAKPRFLCCVHEVQEAWRTRAGVFMKLLEKSAEVVIRPACVISSGGPIENAMFIGTRWRSRALLYLDGAK